MTDYICRACSVDSGIKRATKTWAKIGTCPYCEERHALYVVKPGELDAEPGIGSSDGFSRAVNPDLRRQEPDDYCRWY